MARGSSTTCPDLLTKVVRKLRMMSGLQWGGHQCTESSRPLPALSRHRAGYAWRGEGGGFTQHEEDFHAQVAGAGGAAGGRQPLLTASAHADAVGDGDGHVEGGEQDESVPARLEGPVMQQDEGGLADGGHLVLGQRGLVPKDTLMETGGGQPRCPVPCPYTLSLAQTRCH